MSDLFLLQMYTNSSDMVNVRTKHRSGADDQQEWTTQGERMGVKDRIFMIWTLCPNVVVEQASVLTCPDSKQPSRFHRFNAEVDAGTTTIRMC